MKETTNDVTILCAIYQGTRKLNEISKKTKIDTHEADLTLEKLSDNALITMG